MSEMKIGWLGAENDRLIARIEALEAALIDAKVCIVNYSDPKELNKVAKFLVGIDIALGNDTVPRPQSSEAQARIEALEAAGKGLAAAVTLMEACRSDDGPDSGWWSEDSILAMDKGIEALAAWRAAEKGYGDE